MAYAHEQTRCLLTYRVCASLIAVKNAIEACSYRHLAIHQEEGTGTEPLVY